MMKYVCIENNCVVSILNYSPSVPSTVTVFTITDEQHQELENGTLKIDIERLTVRPLTEAEQASIAASTASNECKIFLDASDWKVLRHIREQALGIETSLTQQEYLELEQQRETAAKNI
jgi:hypothetical protein